jgi:hypothetical protein
MPKIVKESVTRASISLALKVDSVQPESPSDLTVTILGRDSRNIPHEIEVKLGSNEAYDLYSVLEEFVNR